MRTTHVNFWAHLPRERCGIIERLNVYERIMRMPRIVVYAGIVMFLSAFWLGAGVIIGWTFGI